MLLVYLAIAVVIHPVVDLGSAGVGLGEVVVTVPGRSPAIMRPGTTERRSVAQIAPPVAVAVQAVDARRLCGLHRLPGGSGAVAGVWGGGGVQQGTGGATGEQEIDERDHGEALS